MLFGVSVFESYDGPPIDAVEFSLNDGNWGTRAEIAKRLSGFKRLSAHVPSYLPVQEMAKQLAFDGMTRVVDSFTCHVTKRSIPGSDAWREAWKGYVAVAAGRKLLFENHNQDWHGTDGGMCSAAEFAPLADAGHGVCLDVGHILYDSMFKARDAREWSDVANRAFDSFLELPIEQVHAHTVNAFGGEDHHLEGFDVGPWLRRIVARHPNVTVLVETGHPRYSVAEKIVAGARWLGRVTP